MGYRAVKAVLLVCAAAVGYCFFGSWIWAILSTTTRTVVYVASLVVTYTWQALNPQPATYSSLPELHQVLLNVTTDATRVADLLHEFLSQDPQLRSKFIAFLQQKANTSYTQVDQQLSWVLWLYSVVWMPLLVVTCLARASSRSTPTAAAAAAAAEAADKEDLAFDTHARQHSGSMWGMHSGTPTAAGPSGAPRSSSLVRDASGGSRHLERSFTGVPSRRSSISSRQPSLASQLHQEDQDALYQQQDIPRTKRYGRSRTISSWSCGYDDGLLATAALGQQPKAAVPRTASVRPQGPGSRAGSEGMGRHSHRSVSGVSLEEAPLAGLGPQAPPSAAAAGEGGLRSSSDWATAFRRATNGSLGAKSVSSVPLGDSWSEGGSYMGVSRKPGSGSKAAGQLGLAAVAAGGEALARLGSTADTQLRSSDQQL